LHLSVFQIHALNFNRLTSFDLQKLVIGIFLLIVHV